MGIFIKEPIKRFYKKINKIHDVENTKYDIKNKSKKIKTKNNLNQEKDKKNLDKKEKKNCDEINEIKSNDVITIIYKNINKKCNLHYKNSFGEIISRKKIFGQHFVENNKEKCKIIINNKEYELPPFLNFTDNND